MFLSDLWSGFLWALVLIAPVTVAAVIGSRHVERTLAVAAAWLVVDTIINWLLFWFTTPTVGWSKIAIYHEWWWFWWILVATVVFVGWASGDWEEKTRSIKPTVGSVVAAILLVVLGGYGFINSHVWTDGRAKSLAHQIHVVEEKPQEYPDTDANHILQVPEQTADFLANQVLASSKDKELATIYEIGPGTLQSVDNHLYWIYGLRPTGYRNSNKEPNAAVPAFVVVDAENPNAHPVLRQEDASGKPYHILYYPGGYHWHMIERYLWGHGYADQVVSDITLEVNDNWDPYYTASLEVPTIGMGYDVPGKALVMNPQTGDINTYDVGANVPKGQSTSLPNWVDRIYSESKVKEMLNWWGEWDHASYNAFNESSANRYKVAGNPVLVYTKGGHPVWQAVMTSWSKDTSAAYLALFDARDNEVRLYSISGLTLPSAVEHVILGSPKNNKNPPLEPVHLTLHKIYGHLTWVAPLIRSTEGEGGTSAQQGIALLPYDETNGDSLIFAPNGMSEALTQYRINLATGYENAGPEENANTETAEGTISSLSKVVENGSTVFDFTLAGDTKHVYRATLLPSSSGTQNLELPFIHVGAKVRFTYLNIGSAQRNVGNYDDLELQVGSGG